MLSYTHFTTDERKCLQKLLEEGYSIRGAAAALGRSPSSVSREIKRNRSVRKTKKNRTNRFCYHYWRANTLAKCRRRRKAQQAMPLGSECRFFVIEHLSMYWSPEQIAAVWRREHPESTLCFATIYRYIKKRYFGQITAKKNLRRRGKNRNLVRRNCYVIHPDRTIPEWPDIIRERGRIGDWEGDTVYGGIGKGLLVTLVERKTRFLCAGFVRSRDAGETAAKIRELLDGLPVHSLSLDNGSEFADFRNLEKSLGAPVYFAEPHKPWQRGTNENTNDILRFFFPKGFNFLSVTDSQIAAVVDLINHRPRKCLDWCSPSDAFFSVALT